MQNLSVKTKILNSIRTIGKIRFVENLLVQLTQDKPLNNFYSKLIPNYYQYQPGTTRIVNRNGIKFNLDISDYMEYIIYYGIQVEPREKLYNLIKNGYTVLDIGANIGETLLNFAKVNQAGKNIGFEPVPYIYDRLKMNIALNNFSNIETNNIALSDKNEMLSFSPPKDQNSGGVRMRKEADKSKYNANQEVEAFTLDNFLAKRPDLSKIDFIKMDIEGFEFNVLKGATATLSQQRAILFIEVDDQMLKQQNASASELVKFISEYNYQIENADNGQRLSANSSELTNCHFDIICTPN